MPPKNEVPAQTSPLKGCVCTRTDLFSEAHQCHCGCERVIKSDIFVIYINVISLTQRNKSKTTLISSFIQEQATSACIPGRVSSRVRAQELHAGHTETEELWGSHTVHEGGLPHPDLPKPLYHYHGKQAFDNNISV